MLISRDGDGHRADIASLAQRPNLPHPAPRFLEAGPAGIRTAVLFPSWHQPGTKLPVLMDPYGGPGMQRVVKTASMFLTSQWFAEQGFAVIVADGRGTPGRGPSWDRTIAGDFATGVLEDQVTALGAAAEQFTDLDTSRVAIRGWSFGGYLSALAVLRRPDVFHAGIAGAPPTDWRLYDTHYTERYLGDPATNAAAYQVSSLIDDPQRAVQSVIRPLLIIHGLADDNVFVAHSLRLSSALLAAGYPHSVLPLSGDHAHDVAGDGRGEHAPAPGRVPEAGTRPFRRGRVADAGTTAGSRDGEAAPGRCAAGPCGSGRRGTPRSSRAVAVWPERDGDRGDCRDTGDGRDVSGAARRAAPPRVAAG